VTFAQNNQFSLIKIYGEVLVRTDKLEQIAAESPEQIVDLPGHFAVHLQTGGLSRLIGSRYGLAQCFYHFDGRRLHHGADVRSVCQSAGLDWQWNWRALAAVSCFEHVLGNDSLHPLVSRLGAGEIVTVRGGSLDLRVAPPPEVERFADPAGAAMDALMSYVQRYGGENPVVSMSAGFDSRVILAAFLASGIRPRLVSGGYGTDVRMSKKIAAKYGLELEAIDLPVADFLDSRLDIAQLTSGSKTACNWHTYVYAKRAGLKPSDQIFIGSNGEFARTFYFDRGAPFILADLLSRWTVPKFWNAKLARFAHLPEDGTNPGLLSRLGPRQQEARAYLLQNYGGPLGDSMDEFYLRERVRNFIANGLALVGAFARPRTPFVTTEWISAIRQTPRRMKLGNAWHRSTIAKLEPSLLAFPVDDALRPMGRRAELNYWTGRVGHTKDTPAMDYAALFAAASFEAAIDHAINRLDDVVDRDAAGRFLESASRQERTRTLSYLMALGTFKELLAQP
jgi:asparagine synthase (glutamine-hydrolysing)